VLAFNLPIVMSYCQCQNCADLFALANSARPRHKLNQFSLAKATATAAAASLSAKFRQALEPDMA